MRRPRLRALRRPLALAAVLAIAGVFARTRTGGRAGDDIPTFTVTAGSFVRRVTSDGTLRAVRATPVVVPRIDGLFGALKIASLAPDGTLVKAGDVVARFDRAEAERQLRDAEIDLEAADAALRQEQIKAAAREADHAAAAALARREADQVRQFQATDPLVFSRGQIAEAALDERLASARQAEAERTWRIDRGVARSDVELAAIARRRAELALGHARTALANLEVRAPGDGVLVLHRDDHGDVPRLGAQTWAGEALAEIPAPGEMEAEVFVLEVDGSGLDVGQAAELVVASRPELAFHGAVRFVDKLAKPRQSPVPVQYFAAVVALDRTDRAVMKPGQRVRATLVLGEQDAITVPRQAVFERAGQAIVYRKDARGFSPVPVALGAATPGRIAVTSGLTGGDVIAERDPTLPLDSQLGSQLDSPVGPEPGSGSATGPAKGTP